MDLNKHQSSGIKSLMTPCCLLVLLSMRPINVSIASSMIKEMGLSFVFMSIGTSIEQVEMTQEFLSSSFSMKDLGEADVILGIKIIRHNGGLMLNQSHYIEKILNRFNMFDKSPFSTPMDPCEKLLPYKG